LKGSGDQERLPFALNEAIAEKLFSDPLPQVRHALKSLPFSYLPRRRLT
jgi:hypothetical protein